MVATSLRKEVGFLLSFQPQLCSVSCRSYPERKLGNKGEEGLGDCLSPPPPPTPPQAVEREQWQEERTDTVVVFRQGPVDSVSGVVGWKSGVSSEQEVNGLGQRVLLGLERLWEIENLEAPYTNWLKKEIYIIL